MNYLHSLGPLALASRLKNLSDTLMHGVARIYHEMDLDFEPRWFPVTHYLFTNGPVPVTTLSKALQQTHPAILQVTQVMKKKGLVLMEKNEKDMRETIISLTPKGKIMAENLTGIWADIANAAQKLLDENGVDLLKDIALLEESLEKEGIYTRVKKEFVHKHLNNLLIKEFTSDYLEEYKEINYQWLKESVGISKHDKEVLDNPDREILQKGGQIYLAFAETELVGTYTLIALNKDDIQLTKFAVGKSFRKMGIGKQLLNDVIKKTESGGYRRIILLTHSTLTEATKLYLKAGFTEISSLPELSDPSGRCSITMQYIVNH